jgi:hypothetical protein
MFIIDHVKFLMPKDRELQFPAMALVQQFVNGYNEKMIANDYGQGNKFQLRYDLDIDLEDWKFFERVQLKLDQPREVFTSEADLVCDFREDRLMQFRNSGKHAAQAYGVLCGVEVKPVPMIRQVLPPRTGTWGILPGMLYDAYIRDSTLIPVEGEQLVSVRDGVLLGVIGYAGWETYLAASLGLAVVEILPEGRPVTWLSKFFNTGYRPIRTEDGDIDRQIAAAVRSIQETVCSVPVQETVV